MRLTRTVQISIFEKFSEHEYGAQLKHLSAILDQHPQLVDIVSHDFGGCQASCRLSYV